MTKQANYAWLKALFKFADKYPSSSSFHFIGDVLRQLRNLFGKKLFPEEKVDACCLVEGFPQATVECNAVMSVSSLRFAPYFRFAESRSRNVAKGSAFLAAGKIFPVSLSLNSIWPRPKTNGPQEKPPEY